MGGIDSTHWIPQLTQDGSFTFFSEEFGEAFHSKQGAKAEAFQKFAAATQLTEKALSASPLRLLDVCYGLGYNTAAAIETIWTANPECRIEIYGLELDATVPQAAIGLIESWSDSVQSDFVQEALRDLAFKQAYQSDRLTAKLLIGDARQTILQLDFQADAIFLDPFSPRRCPQLWTVEFFQAVSQCLAPTGRLATYSRSASVRSALLQVGLAIGSIPTTDSHAAHEWSQGTIASFDKTDLPPLSQMEQEHLQTRAAIPYRDPGLSDAAIDILARHQQEQKESSLESTSSWRRRWKIR